jgi:hypothetical protein
MNGRRRQPTVRQHKLVQPGQGRAKICLPFRRLHLRLPTFGLSEATAGLKTFTVD